MKGNVWIKKEKENVGLWVSRRVVKKVNRFFFFFLKERIKMSTFWMSFKKRIRKFCKEEKLVLCVKRVLFYFIFFLKEKIMISTF